MTRLSLLPTLLSVVALMFTATLAYLLTAPLPEYESPSTPKSDPVSAVSLPEPFAPPPLAEFVEIDERLLFVPGRRPFRQTDVELPPPEPRKPPSATLIGVIVDGKHKIAVAKVGGKAVNLVLGATIEGWSVVAIESDRVAFKVDDESFEIRLPKAVASPSGQPRTAALPRLTRIPPPPEYGPGQVSERP